MIVRVEFTNPKLQDFVMEGPRVDYQIHESFLVAWLTKINLWSLLK